MMLGQKISYAVLSCCALIIIGYFLGIDQENSLGKRKIGHNNKRLTYH